MSRRLDIGDEHEIEFVSYKDDDCTGINVFHKTTDGKDCIGWVPFRGRLWESGFAGKIEAWNVLSMEPLTLSPSIACRACKDHGYIRNGKWERA